MNASNLLRAARATPTSATTSTTTSNSQHAMTSADIESLNLSHVIHRLQQRLNDNVSERKEISDKLMEHPLVRPKKNISSIITSPTTSTSTSTSTTTLSSTTTTTLDIVPAFQHSFKDLLNEQTHLPNVPVGGGGDSDVSSSRDGVRVDVVSSRRFFFLFFFFPSNYISFFLIKYCIYETFVMILVKMFLISISISFIFFFCHFLLFFFFFFLPGRDSRRTCIQTRRGVDPCVAC